jgi:hypothetical protein
MIKKDAMKLLFVFLSFLIFSFSSCFLAEHEPTEKEFKKAIDNEVIDNRIIKNFGAYESIANVIIKNINAITKKAHEIEGGSMNYSCFTYYYNTSAQNTNIKDLPDFVYKRIDSLWKILGNNGISSIEICNDKLIIINAIMKKSSNNITVVHELIWNIKPFDNNNRFSLLKDTLLSKECTYRIGVAQGYSGW